MADNTTLNPGTSGDAIRDIDKGGVKTQVVTLDVGGAGAETLLSGAVPVGHRNLDTLTLLNDILTELRVVTFYLKEGLNIEDNPDSVRDEMSKL